MSDFRDLKSFQAFFETLNIESLTLDSDREAAATAFQYRTPQLSLHTLPELHLEGDEPAAGIIPQLRLIGTLGEGGMGLVSLANQLPLDREVAVKTTRAGLDEAATQALLQEAYVTGFLEHPNIIPIYTVGRTRDGAPLIVMKRVEGDSWLDLLDTGEREGMAADLVRHIEILIQVCNAVRFAHSKGIIHRDIKPDNVMVGHFDEVYLLDWGIAVSLEEGRPGLPQRSDTKGVAGTPQYMAPEMTLEQPELLDERTDIYLLGATLHQVLTGRPRHQGEHLLKVMFAAHRSEPYEYGSDVPAELAAIANRACHPDKEERFQTVEAFREALHDFLEHRESIALSTSAERKRAELDALLTADEPDVLAIHDTYGECRFGFHQALRIWPDNTAATDGLQRCLEAMAGYYLSQSNLDAARACIAELPQARPALAERADALADRLDEDEEDLQRLKELERDLDMRTSTSSRSRLAYILAVLWTGTSLMEVMRMNSEVLPYAEQLQNYMVSGVRNFSIAAIALFIFRKRVFTNAANRRLVYLLLTIAGAVAFSRIGVWHAEGSIVHGRTADYIIYAVGIVGVGLMSDLRICLIALGFAGAALTSILSPELQSWAAIIANAVTFTAFGWIWSPSQMKKKVSF